MKEIVFRKRSLWFLLISFVMGFYVLNGNLALASGQEKGATPYSTLKEQNIKRALRYEELKEAGVSVPSTRILSVALPLDTDDDGMSDSWEQANGLNPNDPDDAWFDPDGDAVVNLFEYQLDSNPASPTTPPFVTVAPSNADYDDVEDAIDAVAAGTAIRVAEGSYPVNYITFDLKIVMIQGGWNSNFSQRDLSLYSTIFDGEMQDEILYFSVSRGQSVIILDGIHFVRGNGFFGAVNLLARGSASMKTSLFNCSITQSNATIFFGAVLNIHNWQTSRSDRTIANTLIAGNTASGIYAQITNDTVAHWRIINTTISNNKNGGDDNDNGIEAFTLTNGLLTAHVYNSILWGNEQDDLSIRRNITFEVDHSDMGNVEALFGAIYQPGAGVLEADPLFMEPGNDDYHLSSDSPGIDKGISQGIPLIDFEGDIRVSGPAPDIGADEYVLKSKSMPWMLLLWSDDES